MTSAARNYTSLLLDIEGTTTPISFVTDVLFPYAEAAYGTYIKNNWHEDSFKAYKHSFAAEDANLVKEPETLIAFVRGKHAKNEKHTAFKSLQGALWQSGYEDGSIKSIIYPDVSQKLTALKGKDIQTFIYSSGSIPAQKLLFKYSDQGDLTPLLSGYFDTSTAGPKTESTSYEQIARVTGIKPASWLFLSDNVKEVRAAQKAGMTSFVVERPGNAELAAIDREQNTVIQSFDSI